MINIKDQNSLFALLGESINKKIECYAVGGTAMMYLGLKSTTKDIDLVFLNQKGRQVFENVLLHMGFSYLNPRTVYNRKGSEKNLPVMLSRGEEFRFDLFVKKVVTFELSNRITQRVIQKREFDKLILNIVSPEDIILLKCATDREGDLFDAKAIVQIQNSVNWDFIVDEVIQQADKISYGPFRLHDFLSRLEEKHELKVPMRVFEKLENWIVKFPETKK